MLVKLVNGYCIACYYEGGFIPKKIANKEGIIMSLTNFKYYTTNERNKKAVVHDDYFIIFGNSEVRIKSQERKVFSNFGLNSSYYRHNGDKVDMLLGGDTNQREIDF